MIPLNNIKSAVIAVLRAKYGEEMTMYGEDILEGVQKPCFFVKIMPVKSAKEIGPYRDKVVQVAVTYIPDPDDETTGERPRHTIHGVYDDLDYDLFNSALAVTTSEDDVRKLLPGNNDGQFIDDALVYTFTLSFVDAAKRDASEVEYEDMMETLDTKMQINDEGQTVPETPAEE
jgi:hypothetical protein